MPKRQLVRIIMVSQNSITVDTTGKKPGRGAYLCGTPACLERAIKNKALERSFKQSLPDQALELVKAHYRNKLA